ASCDGCDNCLEPRETFDGTVPAQKFLSCIQRVRRKSGFSFGLNHIVDVLNGADTEPIRQRGHDQLSTYGIGQDLKRGAWLAIGRELLRLGLVTTTAEFGRIPGVGQQKLRDFAEPFTTAIAEYLAKRSRQSAKAIEA